MTLLELQPKWWAAPGRRGQGVIFLCPHCRQAWLVVAFANPLDGGPPWNIGTKVSRRIKELWRVLYGLERFGRSETPSPGAVLDRGQVAVPPGFLWTRSGEDLEHLTISPSVDASPAGCWHGFVRGGMIC